MFSPACASATNGSTRMSRRKNCQVEDESELRGKQGFRTLDRIRGKWKQPIIPGNLRVCSCAVEENQQAWLDVRPGLIPHIFLK